MADDIHDHEPCPPVVHETNRLELRDFDGNLLWRTTVTWKQVVLARAAIAFPDLGTGDGEAG